MHTLCAVFFTLDIHVLLVLLRVHDLFIAQKPSIIYFLRKYTRTIQSVKDIRHYLGLPIFTVYNNIHDNCGLHEY